MNDIEKAFSEYAKQISESAKEQTRMNIAFASVIFISVIALLLFMFVNI